jgi:hypothetical protein
MTAEGTVGAPTCLMRYSQASRSGTFACATAILSTHFIISIAGLENVPPDAGFQKRASFSTLNVGLAGIGNRTRATSVASSGTSRSAIHYAFPLNPFPSSLTHLTHEMQVIPSTAIFAFSTALVSNPISEIISAREVGLREEDPT